METLPYYPSRKYIQKGWAPERFPVQSLKDLAAAQTIAVKQGLLSQALAEKLLPLALVEGRDDFGVNTYGYPVNAQRDDAFRRLGLSVGKNKPLPPDATNWGDAEYEAWGRKNPPVYQVTPTSDGSGYTLAVDDGSAYARMAAAMLAEKARLYGEDKAIERWNGYGKRIGERSKRVFADSSNHARKVEEMHGLLNDPVNAELMRYYGGLLK